MQGLNFKFYAQNNQIVQDAYDMLIANLHSDGAHPKTICVTGSTSRVGKTTVAVNLAISLTMANWKVLFIDADLRKDFMNKRLAEQNLLGLSDFLATNQPYENIVSSTNFDNLFYITCGDLTSINPIGLLCSQRFDDLLKTGSENFDFVIIDTPSVNAVADPSVVAAKCDATFVVIEMGKTPESNLRTTMEMLKKANVSVTGVILNKADKSEYKSYYGGYNYFKTQQKNKAVAATSEKK